MTTSLLYLEIFQFISCWLQGPLAWAGTSKGGKSSTWWRRPVEVGKEYLFTLDEYFPHSMKYQICSFSKLPQLPDGAKMRGTEPTLLGQGPKLPLIRSKEELLPPIRNNRELSKTRHQRVLHLASCQPELRGISPRSLKRVWKRSAPVQDRRKSKSPREELLMANLWSSCWSI